MAEINQSGDEAKTLVNAIRSKYLNDNGMEDDLGEIAIFVPKRGPAKVSESGDVTLPKIIHVTNSGISLVGDCTQLNRMCGEVCELDVMENCFSSWAEVVKIVTEIPNLTFLNLTSNPLRKWDVTLDPEVTFTNVRQLVLNHTYVDWTTLLSLLHVVPSLIELHLSLNAYDSIDLPSSFTYPSLRKLHFNGNKVCDWEHVKKIGQSFPSLENLVLTECGLDSLGPKEDLESTFPRLSVLNVSKTRLAGWEEFDKLQAFPVLTDVRVVGIPFCEGLQEKKRRALMVARMPTITRLNGSPVMEQEREDAERAFIRHYMDEDVKPDRYFELESKYGKLDPLVNLNMKPEATARVIIIFNDTREEMKISTNQTVAEFKKLMSNIVGLPPSKWILYYHDVQLEQGAAIVTSSNRYLHSLRVCDNDEFYLEVKR